MSDKDDHPTLLNRIKELEKQNEILRSSTSFRVEEKKRLNELLEAKEKANKSESYFNDIINKMGDMVFIKDDQCRLIMVNDAFCKTFGLSRDKIIGTTMVEDISPEELDGFLKVDRQVLNEGKEIINEEELTLANNEKIALSTRKTRFIDSDGKRFLIGATRDITKRKKAEEALKNSETELRKLNATRDKLFSIIAHDLRSPFSHILGFSELLIEAGEKMEPAKVKKYLKLINSSSRNTLTLLDNLLKWADSQNRQLEAKSEKINLSNAINEIIALLDSMALSKKITLKYSPTEDIIIDSDGNLLKTILRNLISNALKFTLPGGNVNITAIIKQNQVEVSVSDDGVGISPDMCKKLFDLSTNISSLGTAKEKGFGLGLALCIEFVKKLGGDIWVESEVQKGSDFKFTLPLNNEVKKKSYITI